MNLASGWEYSAIDNLQHKNCCSIQLMYFHHTVKPDTQVCRIMIFGGLQVLIFYLLWKVTKWVGLTPGRVKTWDSGYVAVVTSPLIK